MSTVYYVYTDLCIESNKLYVGITKHSPEIRWYQKVYDSKNRLDERNYKLINAIAKYGGCNWSHQILYCSKDVNHISEMEKYFIDSLDTFNNGYNSCLGGIGYPKYESLTQAHKLSIKKGLQRAYDCGFRKPVSHNEYTRNQIRIAKSTGVWKTPFGEFLSSREAAKFIDTSKTNIKNWCKSPDKLVTQNSPNKFPHIFKNDHVGKKFKDIGFSFSSNEL